MLNYLEFLFFEKFWWHRLESLCHQYFLLVPKLNLGTRRVRAIRRGAPL